MQAFACLVAVMVLPAWAFAARSAQLDRSTPRQSVAGFLRAVENDEMRTALQFMELQGVPRREMRPVEAAEQLAHVLNSSVWIDVSAISDHPDGNPEDGAELERIATVDVDGEDIPISLVRTQRGGSPVWRFSSATVARIPDLATTLDGPSWIVRLVPSVWKSTRIVGLWPWQWFGLLLAIVGGLPLGYVAGRLTTWTLGRIAKKTRAQWDDEIVAETRSSLRFAFAWLAMGGLAMSLDLPASVERWVVLLARTPLILATGWLLRKAVRAITSVYLRSTQDDRELDHRGLRTQIVILRRLSTVAIALVTFGIVMMQFDIVRSVGLSLLASAGVAGVALGFAAQKSLADVIAGLQLSMSQPIRLGDSIVVRGEWGVVEEIALTYVRIKLWDERRLVVPIEKFLHEIFENWSVPGDGMIGIVELPVDPTAPVEQLRAEVERVAKEHPAHDGRECRVQVLEINEHRALLRIRVSTSDISRTFQMRCDIRESMMDYLQRLEGGRYLARQRFERVSGQAS